ncbi:hypothetical protein ScPMuIL_017119 [Solemya velum]
MSDYLSIAATLLLILVMIEATAGYYPKTPTNCKDRYDRCIREQVYPEYECEFDRLKCLLQYCSASYARDPRRSHKEYLSRLFACCLKYKVPAMLLETLKD